MAKSRITCRKGDGWRWDTARVVGLCWPKENRRERGGRRLRVGEERPGRKAGEGSRDGWRRERVFKREGNATQRPGAPLLPSGSGGAGGGGGTAHPGNGLSPEHLGGLQEAGRGEKVPRMLSTHPARIQDAGAWVQDGRRVLGLGWELDNPAPNGLILPPWRKTTPPAAGSGRQLRRWDSSQFKVAKGNSLHDIEASLLPLRCRAAWLSSLLNSLFKI